MLSDIDILCQLQSLDNKITKAIKEKERLPKIIEEFEKKSNAQEESIKNLKQRFEQNLHQQKRLELDITINNRDINKYENQLLLVKTNKEYKALNSEITHRKEKNTEIEEQLIELLEAEACIKEEKKKLEELFNKDKIILEKEKDKIYDEIEKLITLIRKLEEKKVYLSKKIPENLYTKYKLLIKHKNGKAIASIENSVCSGCHFRIRSQIIVEVYKGEKITTCENCSRILVPPNKIC
ncbi:MAG: hypothetical protein ISS28_04240 [Candidatus Cloacimonetes bacterium]|nr:hypothetical protein [Candidatus Cloacimonadota bacterium]MBL7086293.1 hypothetical protein [Candidatus Cloacimonadota bacterium]